MKQLEDYTSVYFVGAGGIGMSALERYCLSRHMQVAGYDRTPSDLTDHLEREGVQLTFVDDVESIPATFRNPATTLVVRTPAVPAENSILHYFMTNGFEVVKRAHLLGLVTRSLQALCFAGTHGKTTTSSMTAHIFKSAGVGCNAFLGGILRNYDSNLLLAPHSPYAVVEADEYDRSFHTLTPYIAVVTAVDADHLDIYGTPEAYVESFAHFTSLIRPGGALVMKHGIALQPRLQAGVRLYTYSKTCGDFHAANIRYDDGSLTFDFVTPRGVLRGIEPGVPTDVNIENAVASMAVAWLCGIDGEAMRSAMHSFMGARRRFEYWLRTPGCVMVDDYAHHPDEIRATIQSARLLYPGRKLSVVFQPHLYTRTRDFAAQFAASLSLADEVILLDIYPAREEPLPGVTSQIIYDKISAPHKELCAREMLLKRIKEYNFEVLLTMGAGDIDRLLPQICDELKRR